MDSFSHQDLLVHKFVITTCTGLTHRLFPAPPGHGGPSTVQAPCPVMGDITSHCYVACDTVSCSEQQAGKPRGRLSWWGSGSLPGALPAAWREACTALRGEGGSQVAMSKVEPGR